MASSLSTSIGGDTPRRIHFRQHWSAVRRMLVAYPPGTDALVDQIRTSGFLRWFLALNLLLPLYLAREQGWFVPGPGGDMAAMMYLRRDDRQGIRVLHIDDINVDAAYRRRGLAQRLMRLADELAMQEQRPFLKLAVTVANTPAVTLYRSLGYQEQHHRFVTFNPAAIPLRPPKSADLTLRPLDRRAAVEAHQRFYRMEMLASAAEVGKMMAAYYPVGAGLNVPKSVTVQCTVLRHDEQVGYADAYRRGTQWNLRLYLAPSFWGSECELQAIQLLSAEILGSAGSELPATIALYVPSSAHFDALASSMYGVAGNLDFTIHSYERMIMVKSLSTTSWRKE